MNKGVFGEILNSRTCGAMYTV